MEYNDSSELFNESNFFKLFDEINSKTFLTKTGISNVMKSDVLKEFVLSYEDIIKEIIKYNSLYFFDFVDLITKQENKITEKQKNNIKTFYNEYDIDFLEDVWYFTKDNISDTSILRYEPIISDMEIKGEFYFHFILNRIWISKPRVKYDVGFLAKKLLLSFYRNKFHKDDDKIEGFKHDSPEYKESLKLMLNPNYQEVMTVFDNHLLDLYSTPIYPLDSNDPDYKRNIIMNYFEFLIIAREVNKNIITWFFFIYYDLIPVEIIKDYFAAIFGWNKNLSGYIFKILRYLEIDYYKISEPLNDLIKNLENKHDYLFTLHDDLSLDNMNFEIEDVINNLYILQKINNIFNSDISNFNIFASQIENIDFMYLFAFYFISPLKESVEAIKIEMKQLYEHYNYIIMTIKDIIILEEKEDPTYVSQDEESLSEEERNKLDSNRTVKAFIKVQQIYNSTHMMRNKGRRQKVISYNDKIELLDYIDFTINIFDKKTLAYHLVKLLRNFEIIPLKDETLKTNLEKKSRVSLKNLKEYYFSLDKDNKELYYGYSRIK